MFDPNDIRSLDFEEQLAHLSQPSPLGSTEHTNHVELASIRCLIRLVRHIYFIRAIQLHLKAESFQGYPSVEDDNPILEYAWMENLRFELSGQLYPLKEKFGQCHNVVEMIESALMMKSLWSRPEFRVHNSGTTNIRASAIEIGENLGPLIWLRNVLLLAGLNIRVDNHSVTDQKLTIIGGNQPVMLKVTICGSSVRAIPGIVWLEPGRGLFGEIQQVSHSEGQVYVLAAVVWVKASGENPEITAFKPHEMIQRTSNIIDHGITQGTCTFLFARFAMSEIIPGGPVEELLNPREATVAASEVDHVMQDIDGSDGHS